MVKFEATILFEEGMHARPASELVKVCQSAVSDIKMTKGETTVNPKSILGILTLGGIYKDVIGIEVEGEDEAVIAEKLKEFFDTQR